VLTNGSHELLREEICLAIYAMASPDFEAFFKQSLPSYLLNCQGIEDQQRLLLKNGFSNDTVLVYFIQSNLNVILKLIFVHFQFRTFHLLHKISIDSLTISDAYERLMFPTRVCTSIEELSRRPSLKIASCSNFSALALENWNCIFFHLLEMHFFAVPFNLLHLSFCNSIS